MPLKARAIAEHARKGSPAQNAKILGILTAAGGKLLNLRAKTFLYQQGDGAAGIYFVNRGTVGISTVSPEGKHGKLGQHSAGDFVGEVCLTPQPLYLDTAIARTECEVVRLTANEVFQAMHSSLSLTEYFIQFLLDRAIEVQSTLTGHLFDCAEKRLASVLLLLANGSDNQFQPIVGVTHEMLAERVGTTRARITHFMNKFRRLGFVEYDGAIKVYSGLLDVVVRDIKKSEPLFR